MELWLASRVKQADGVVEKQFGQITRITDDVLETFIETSKQTLNIVGVISQCGGQGGLSLSKDFRSLGGCMGMSWRPSLKRANRASILSVSSPSVVAREGSASGVAAWYDLVTNFLSPAKSLEAIFANSPFFGGGSCP